MKDITLKNADQLGRLVRLKRQEKGLSQSALAELLGVERKWVLRLESGNPRAELGLILKLLEALGIEIRLKAGGEATSNEAREPPSRLDEVFRRLQRPARK